MLPIIGEKYLMTEFDGNTKKEIIYNGSERTYCGKIHKIYIIEDDIEFEASTEMLISMHLENCK